MSSTTAVSKLTTEALWTAVRDGDLETVSRILNEEISQVECETADSWTVLHEAAVRGHTKILEYFRTVPGLSQYMTRVAMDHHAQTPLVCAIAHGHVEAFKVLWQWMGEEDKIDPFLETAIALDRYQWCLLGWAVYSGSTEAVDHILSLKLPGMDVHCTRPGLFSAAMTKGSVELIRHLIDIGVDVNASPDLRQSPLTIAVRRGLLDVVKTMVLYGKADINARDDRGNTALDAAEKYGQFECADFLRSIMLKEGSLDASSNENFSMSVRWFRPRLLGPLLSARACATCVAVDNYLYITAGQGYKEEEPCPTPDNYSSPTPHALTYKVYRIALPALDIPMLPPDAPFMHLAMTARYEMLKIQIPAPKLRKMNMTSEMGNISPHAQQWSARYGSELNQVADEARLEVKYLPGSVQAPAVTFARLPFPKRLPFAYFEVTLLDVGQYGYIGIGISRLCDDTEQHLGWTVNAYGCHADIGCVFHHSSSGGSFAPKFQKNDVVGCGIDFNRHELFYTVNGKWAGVSHQGVDIDLDWHPAISLQSPGEHIRANFGSEPFLFDFVAPTLTLESLSQTTVLGEHTGRPSRLAQAPESATSTKLALIRLSTRTIHFLVPNQPPPADILDNEQDAYLAHAPLRQARKLALGQSDGLGAPVAWMVDAEWSWKALNIVADPNSPYSAYDFWQAMPNDPSADLASISTDTHWFCVVQNPNTAQTHITLTVFGIEWATGIISRVDLPPLEVPKKAPNAVYRIECSMDSSRILAWSFYVPEIYAMDVLPIFQSIREKTTAKEVPPQWVTTASIGHHPSSSRLAATSLTNNLTLCFGGFEEIAPQNTVQVLDSRDAVGPKWLKPRIDGCTLPRARFFTTLVSTPAVTNLKREETKIGADPASNASSMYHPHLHNDAHDYTIYAVCGWNGWTGVYDFDVAHVTLPKPVVDPALNTLNDISIVTHDGSTVETAKIMLYCRASFFRDFFSSSDAIAPRSDSNSQPESINLSQFLNSPSGEKISGSVLRVLIGFLITDTLAKSAIDSIPNLLTAVELLCPEHLPRIQDELFASRMTHPSTLAADLSRSQHPSCPIPCDMQFLPTIAGDSSAGSSSLPIPSPSVTHSTFGGDQAKSSDLRMHTYIAALKSSFFRAMVQGDFLESRLADGLRIVSIQADHDLAQLFIAGICAGKVDLELVGDRIIDLFELSHSLQAIEFLDFLEQVLCANIDADNVDMLESVAKDHNAFKLLEACASFRSVSNRHMLPIGS